jgi:cell division protein FtsW
MTSFARTDTSLLGRWWWTVDRLTLAALGLLIGIGIVLTLAASPAVANRIGADSFHFVRRQFLFLAPSVLLMFAISLLTPLQVRRFAAVALTVAYALLLLTLVMGAEIKGATRWIAIGPLSIQPSEFVKPAFIVVSAWMLSERARDPSFPGWTLAVALWLAVVVPLIRQPDFGQTLLVSMVWGAQLFLAGLPMLVVVVMVFAGIGGIVGGYLFLPHVTSRIDRFLNPESGDTFQVDTALDAFMTGGMWGRGPGEGVVKRILPDAHTDFIFAVAGEEFGTIACLILVIQFGCQAVINMGVNLHLLPSKGMTLPFISYGGSSMLALAMGMGMLLALTRTRPSLAPLVGGLGR